MSIEVGGHVEPGFEGVRDAFAQQLRRARRGRAPATPFYVEGTKVVDLWGGVRTDTGAAYDDDTLQIVFSTTKGATAVVRAPARAARRCSTSTRRSSTYWPEFGQAGKEHIPVRWLLSHQAGLADRRRQADARRGAGVGSGDPRARGAGAATGSPASRTATTRVTYGYLVGEVVRRIDGRSIGKFFHDEIAEPLGLEFWIGLPEEYEPRVGADDPDGQRRTVRAMVDMLGAESLIVRALSLNGAFGSDLGTTRQRARLPRRRDPRRQRHHQRAVAGAACTRGSSAASTAGRRSRC